MMITIWGAGMAGLLAGNAFRDTRIIEQQKELPDNHGALLRFRSDVVRSVARDAPMRRVRITKAILNDYGMSPMSSATLADFNRYSMRATGQVMDRSARLGNEGGDERWIAGETFLSELEKGAGTIEYGEGVDGLWPAGQDNAIISTLPMPLLMEWDGWPERPDFQWLSIESLRATIKWPTTDVYQTVYNCTSAGMWYRASITGDRMIVELRHMASHRTLDDDEALQLIDELLKTVFGFDTNATLDSVRLHFQKYGKLIPIDEEERRSFITHLTDEYGIYSLGRFATWRQLLLDDVVRDIDVIRQMITDRSHYNRRLHNARCE